DDTAGVRIHYIATNVIQRLPWRTEYAIGIKRDAIAQRQTVQRAGKVAEAQQSKNLHVRNVERVNARRHRHHQHFDLAMLEQVPQDEVLQVVPLPGKSDEQDIGRTPDRPTQFLPHPSRFERRAHQRVTEDEHVELGGLFEDLMAEKIEW